MENSIVLVVSISIIKDGAVLIIKENTPNIKNKWNLPSGRIEIGEDIFYAAKREVKEETGLDVELTNTTGIYNFISTSQAQVIMFHFVGKTIGGSIKLEEEGIVDSNWVKAIDLVKFDDDTLRNPSVIKQIANCHIENKFYPINLFHKQLK